MAREETLVFAAVGDALERRTVDELKKRLALLPIDAKVTRKGDIAELIAEYLAGDRLHTLWKRLDKTQKLAVAETLYAADGRFDGIRFAAKYGESPNWGSKTDSWGYSTVPSLLQLFIYESLIPEDLQGRLKEFVPRPDETILETVSDDKLPPYLLRQEQWHDPDTRELVTDTVEIPVVYQGTERVAAVELRSMLRLIEAGKVGVSDTTRLPTAAALKAVAALLEGDDYFPPDPEEDDNVLEPAGPIRAFAWPMIVQAAGLAELSGKKLTLSRAGQKALSAPPHETLRAAWRRWLKTKLLDELRRIRAYPNRPACL
jgi:hypothetical protein